MNYELIERVAKEIAKAWPDVTDRGRQHIEDNWPAGWTDIRGRCISMAYNALAALEAGDKIPPEGLTVAPTDYFERLYEENKVNVERQAKEEMREKAAKTCETNDLIEGSLGPLMNVGWAQCQEACAKAIRALPLEDDHD